MTFKNVAEAFNYYRNYSIEQIEQRAAQLKGVIDTDPNADITSINIEIEGLKQAKENQQDKQNNQKDVDQRSFNPITGMNFDLGQKVPKDDIYASAEYRSAFLKTMLGQKLTDVETKTYKRAMELAELEKRADAFSTTTSAAAVLPTTTLNEVVSKARTMGGLISEARDFAIPTKLAVPIGTPSTKAQWHTQGVPVESEEPDVDYVAFDGHELIKVFSISAAVRRMSIDAFEAYLVEELTACTLEAIADALVNGTGEGQGTGVLLGVTWGVTNAFTYADAPAYADFAKMLGMLKRGYGAGAKFAMSNSTLYNQVYTLTDLNERPIFVPDPRNDDIGRILGKEVVVDDYIPDGTILVGNWRYMGYNIPEGILVEVSRDSSFRSGLIDYRALAIADTRPLVEEAFVKLDKEIVG